MLEPFLQPNSLALPKSEIDFVDKERGSFVDQERARRTFCTSPSLYRPMSHP
jgi:hypothetical protein